MKNMKTAVEADLGSGARDQGSLVWVLRSHDRCHFPTAQGDRASETKLPRATDTLGDQHF